MPKCGCLRFFDKSRSTPKLYGDGSGTSAKSGFCMCSHHACFHEDSGDGQRGRVQGDALVGERIPVTPQPSKTEPSSVSHMNQPRRNILQDKPPDSGRPHESDLPDTLQWKNFVHTGSSMGSLPAIPSQCLLPSDNGSVSSHSQGLYNRPFAGLGLKTLSHIPKANATGRNATNSGNARPPAENARAMQVYEDSAGHPFMQSLTEVATPRTSQGTGAEEVFSKNLVHIQDALEKLADGKAQTSGGAIALRQGFSEAAVTVSGGSDSTLVPPDTNDALIPRLRSVLNHVGSYPITMQDHERRLGLLEEGSFSNAAVEEVQDNQEHMETRVGELEERVLELEKVQAALNDASSIGSRHHLEGSMDSRMSNTSSALIAAAIDRVDYSRVQALEAQVAELQASAPPSHSRPWEVEVVFIPFGSRLMGIWASQHTITQRSRGNSTTTMEGTQTQYNSLAAAQASLTSHGPATSWEASNLSHGDLHAAWLMPKACGLRSRVDERLRSRGLVKLIQIKGPDARDVQAAMMSAFGDLPATLANDPFTQTDKKIVQIVPESLNKYLGLQTSWIPLRKLHKDSCLRFLNPSEMVTPALWTVSFLSSSVAMRSTGTRRLYVTQPASYIQHLSNETPDWTWPKLRQLDRVYPEGQSFQHTPEADAQEKCWEFDQRLDQPPSLHSSFGSHHSSLSIRSIALDGEVEPTSPSDHFSSAAASPNASTTPTSIAPAPGRPISPLRERHPFRPIHTRTISMPSLVPLNSSHSQSSKRRISSFDHESLSSPILGASVPNLNLKRRRISRSPSRPRDTPRWSVGPPSPYTFVDDIVDRKRGTTPFAYATPHSNAPYVEASSRPRSGADDDDDGQGSTTDDFNVEEGYDQNALSDYDSDQESEYQAHQPDEEWEGVRDEGVMTGYESRTLVGKGGAEGLRQNEEDENSEAGSQPSEYPSTQPSGLHNESKAPFQIYEEVDDDEAYTGVQ